MSPTSPHHGTYYGYRRHQRDGEQPCYACVIARSQYEQRRRDAAKTPCANCGEPSIKERCHTCACGGGPREFCRNGHRHVPDNLDGYGRCLPCRRTWAAQRRERDQLIGRTGVSA